MPRPDPRQSVEAIRARIRQLKRELRKYERDVALANAGVAFDEDPHLAAMAYQWALDELTWVLDRNLTA